MPDVPPTILYGFFTLITVIAGYVAKELKGLTISVEKLNVQLGRVLETQNWQNKTLDEHAKRISRIESKFERDL